MYIVFGSMLIERLVDMTNIFPKITGLDILTHLLMDNHLLGDNAVRCFSHVCKSMIEAIVIYCSEYIFGSMLIERLAVMTNISLRPSPPPSPLVLKRQSVWNVEPYRGLVFHQCFCRPIHQSSQVFVSSCILHLQSSYLAFTFSLTWTQIMWYHFDYDLHFTI